MINTVAFVLLILWLIAIGLIVAFVAIMLFKAWRKLK
jgi:hypothetical protein